MRTGIYRIYHKQTQKSYVGQSVNIPNRIFVHFHSQTIRQGKSLLAASMQDFGKSDFDWEVLEFCNEETLDIRECVWVEAIDPIFPRGYNQKSGGKHGRNAKKEREITRYASQQLSLF